jgi:beta-lactamase superfamily II metal-dependent hydrolase
LAGTNEPDDLFVHFINVGYGDSMLVEFRDGRNILIDGGDREAGAKVAEYLKRRNIEKLDMVIITHPHPDHIEGLFSVIKNYEIDIIIANENISENKDYPLFEVVKHSQCKYGPYSEFLPSQFLAISRWSANTNGYYQASPDGN